VLGKDGVRLWLLRNALSTTTLALFLMGMAASHLLGKDGVRLPLSALPTPTVAPLLLALIVIKMAAEKMGKYGVRLAINAFPP
jgi:hypothetical protein